MALALCRVLPVPRLDDPHGLPSHPDGRLEPGVALLIFLSLVMVSFLVGWYMEREHKKKYPEARMEDLI